MIVIITRVQLKAPPTGIQISTKGFDYCLAGWLVSGQQRLENDLWTDRQAENPTGKNKTKPKENDYNQMKNKTTECLTKDPQKRNKEKRKRNETQSIGGCSVRLVDILKTHIRLKPKINKFHLNVPDRTGRD